MKMEIQYLFLFCVLGEQMQSEEKFKGEISSKKVDRKCTAIISQAFLKYLYLRFQISHISLFTSYLLGGIDFSCVRKKGWKICFSDNAQAEKLVNKQ